MITGTFGSEPIELNNAATEATLQALLQVSSRSAADIAALAGRSGIQIDPVSVENLAKNSGKAAEETKKFGIAASESAKQLKESFKKTTDGLIQGSLSISNFFAALTPLPLGLGKVARGFELVAEYQEENLKVYQSITSAGVNFGGNLSELRIALAGARLTTDQFSTLMASNSDTFLKMGTNVNNGAKSFLSFSNAFLDGEVGNQMRALGFTTEQVNSGLATYIAATGGRNRQEMMDRDSLTKGAKAYFEQLDALTQLTGISREELEKEQKERSANAAFENYLQGLDVKEREKANAALTEAMARGGKGARDALMSRLMGIPPLTPAAQQFETVTRNASSSFNNIIERIRDGTATIDDIRKEAAGITVGLIKDGQENQELFRVLGLQGGDFAEIAQKALAAANKARIQGIDSLSDEEQRLFLANQAIKERQNKSDAANVTTAKKAFEDLGIALNEAIQPLVSKITELFVPIANGLRDLLVPAIESLSEFISPVLDAISDFGTYLKDNALDGIKDIIGVIGEGLKPVIDGLKVAIGPVIKFFGDMLPSGDSLKTSLNGISTFIKENINPYLEQFGNFLKNNVNPFLENLGTFLKNDVLPALGTLTTAIIGGLKPVAEGVIEIFNLVLLPVLDDVIENFSTIALYIRDNFKPAMEAVEEFIEKYLKPAFKSIGEGYTAFAENFKKLNEALGGKLVEAIGLLVTALVGLKIAAIGASAVGLKQDSSILPSRKGQAPAQTPGGGRNPPPAPAQTPGGGRNLPATPTGGGKGALIKKALAVGATVVGANVAQNAGQEQKEKSEGPADSAMGTAMEILGTGAEWAGYGMLLGPKGAAVAGLLGLIYGSGKSIYNSLAGPNKNKKDPGVPNAPDVPVKGMAEGGIVTKPTLSLIGEGKSAEAVIPLDKLEEILLKVTSKNDNSKQEILVKELETLNKQTAEVIRYLRETADYTKQTVDATKSLNGDLFRF